MAEQRPLVDIIADNPADMSALDSCAAMLQRLGVSFERTILSALYDPDGMRAYAERAWYDGRRVAIVGARHGMLAGMIEAFGHRLNMIYVPLGDTELEAKTALFSGVQMPNGHPVNTMGVNRAVNAALSAAKMLSIGHPELLLALDVEHAERSAQARGELS